MKSKTCSPPKILVLLATYNGDDWLSEQLNSLLMQSSVNTKIVVSDDASTDNSINIIYELNKNLPNLTIVPSKVRAGSAGLNFQKLILISNLRDIDYVAFCDQDDIWFLDKLSHSVKMLELSGCDGYSSSVLAFWPNGKKVLIAQSNKIRICDFLFEGAGQGCTFLLTKSAFKKIRNFCIKNKKNIEDFYYHDWLIYLLIRAYNGKWFFDQNPTMYYRQHENNDTGSRGTISSIIKRFEKVKNGWYKKQISIALRIYFLAVTDRNNVISNFSKFFNKKDSIKRRLLMSKFVIFHGRRRFSDRCVLIFASLLGYI